MDLQHHVGLRPDGSVWLPDRRAAAGSILLKLAAMGIEIPADVAGDEDVFHLAGNLFARYREQARLLADHLCPADRRIQHYLDELPGTAGRVRLPAETLILDQYGLARELSLPLDGDRYENELVSSYRLDNGVLHTRPLAVVLGGAGGVGRNMEPEAPDILRASVKGHGQLLVDDTPIKAMVDHLSDLIDAASGPRDQLALMVKVGGSIISVRANRIWLRSPCERSANSDSIG